MSMQRPGLLDGDQQLRDRRDTPPARLRTELGLVLPDDTAPDEELHEEELTILNVGPQHPSTHGVLRLMLELRGEEILRARPVVGYVHTGMEKTAEDLTYAQQSTNVTRMDYVAGLNNELSFCLAAERLLGTEVPERATWIRMLMVELNRIASHLVFMATNGLDMGATSMMIFGFREREAILSFFEAVAGVRLNYNYIRVGGVAADLPDGWRERVEHILDTMPARIVEYDRLFTRQPIWAERSQGVGVLRADAAVALGVTGPALRASGVERDLRRDEPYLFYDDVEFGVIVGTRGDVFDRYAVRLGEIEESLRIVRQVADRMPDGPYRTADRKVTPPPRRRIDESMEALIHHFKLFTEGIKVPEGETYAAVESPRGELGTYLVSDGSAKPYRLHVRGPSFLNVHALPTLLVGRTIADAVAIISSLDPVMGDVDR